MPVVFDLNAAVRIRRFSRVREVHDAKTVVHGFECLRYRCSLISADFCVNEAVRNPGISRYLGVAGCVGFQFALDIGHVLQSGFVGFYDIGNCLQRIRGVHGCPRFRMFSVPMQSDISCF